MYDLGYLPNIVMLLAAAVMIVAVFKRLNLSPVLGYLVAGALIGENGFGYLNSTDLNIFAKFGIVFLLFAIGLELTIERLMDMRSHVFGFGTAQVLLTSTTIGFAVYMIGESMQAAIVIGGALALSSTAIVLRVISDSGGQTTQVGRLALANLLLQDFIVVPLLVLVPLLAKESDAIMTTLASATSKAFIAMFIIFFLGRMLLRPVFDLIASVKSNELFIATTLLIVLGTSLATEYLGLSLALGAFIAGLLVAETRYQHQVEDSIMPFKDLLMGLFFMTVGMTIDLAAMYEQLGAVLGLSVTLILVKALIIIALCRIFRFPWGSAIHAGLLLSQGSEFAFILFSLAANPSLGLLNADVAQMLLLVVTVTMAVTPPLSLLGKWLSELLDDNLGIVEADDENGGVKHKDLNKHVIVAGFGRVGEMVARMLDFKKVNYIIVEADAKRAREGRKKGYPVYHGDPTKVEVLEHVGIDRAKTVIVAIRDNLYMKKMVRAINSKYPYLPIVVRADDLRMANTLKKIGAMVIVPEAYEAGLQLAGALLKATGVSEAEVSRIKNHFRAGNYEATKEMIE